MRWISDFYLVLFALATLAACERDVPDPAAAVPERRLDETLRIGSRDQAGLILSQVGGVLESTHRDIFVADQMDRTIRVFDAQGDPVRAIGGRGEGPGEFASGFVSVGLFADTLFASDFSGRYSVFLLDGTLLETRRMALVGGEQTGSFAPIGRLPDGSLVGTQAIVGSSDPLVPVLRVSVDGRILDTLGFQDLGSAHVRLIGEGRFAIVRHPFPDYGFVLGSPDGEYWVKIDRSRARARGPATFQVTWLSPSGDTVASQAPRYLPTPLPRSRVDSLLSDFIGSLERVERSRVRAEHRARELVEVPEFCLPVADAVVSMTGEVWARGECGEGGQSRWLVVDPRAGAIAHALLPSGVRLEFVGHESAIGVLLDEYGVPFVVRYRIVGKGERN